MTNQDFGRKFSRKAELCSLCDMFDGKYTTRERAAMFRENAWRSYYVDEEHNLQALPYYGLHPDNVVIVKGPTGRPRLQVGFDYVTLTPWWEGCHPTDIDIGHVNRVIEKVRPYWERLTTKEREAVIKED